MKVAIGSDHAGYDLKGKLIPFLQTLGHEVEDLGPYSFNEMDDYPDFCRLVATRVASGEAERGIVIGGSGQGEAMASNRIQSIRAAVFYGGTHDILRLSREHNDANVLALGSRFVTEDEARDALSLWLSTPFSGDERHVRRIAKLDD